MFETEAQRYLYNKLDEILPKYSMEERIDVIDYIKENSPNQIPDINFAYMTDTHLYLLREFIAQSLIKPVRVESERKVHYERVKIKLNSLTS